MDEEIFFNSFYKKIVNRFEIIIAKNKTRQNTYRYKI